VAATCLPHSRDVINVDVKPKVLRHDAFPVRSVVAGKRRESLASHQSSGDDE